MKITLLAAAIALTVPAHAHSWYPMECCAGKDCHEADMVTELPDGSAQVRIGSETILVPRSQKRRQSHDVHYHLCYGSYQQATFIYCFFQPAES